MSRLARERAAADAEEGRWLLCAWRSAAHVHLGYASFSQYIERLFGYKPRSTQEKLRVAQALEGSPRLARSLDSGALSWCAARELTRVAVPETEQAWIEAAQGRTTRELETLVAGKSPGDNPLAPSSNRSSRRVLRFEVAPETFALFREALQSLRRAAGGSLDEDAALLSMARHVLVGSGDEGRASYQISLTVCAACGHGEQQADGEHVTIGPEIVAMAACDAQHLGALLPRAANENANEDSQTSERIGRDEPDEPAVDARLDMRVHEDMPTSGGAAHVGVTEGSEAARSVPVDAGDNHRDATRASRRATQTIPPAMRRAVLARDQGRCRVPGCTHATFVDVHHILPRSEGGANHPANLITICGVHHRATHRGELNIERTKDGHVRFCHADGTLYGSAVTARAIDVQTKVFSALRQLGFREREVRAVLGELRSDPELREATASDLLREALRRIRPVPK